MDCDRLGNYNERNHPPVGVLPSIRDGLRHLRRWKGGHSGSRRSTPFNKRWIATGPDGFASDWIIVGVLPSIRDGLRLKALEVASNISSSEYSLQ